MYVRVVPTSNHCVLVAGAWACGRVVVEESLSHYDEKCEYDPVMETTRVEVRRAPSSDEEADLRRVAELARLLDAKFEVAGIKFGLDFLVGLVPVAGDTITTLVGLYPLMLARRHKLGKVIAARMAANLGVDWLVGLVPLLGDVFDLGFKSNLRNLRLFEEALRRKQQKQD